MKKFLYFALGILAGGLVIAGGVRADVTNSQWKLIPTSTISTVIPTYKVQIPELASANQCVYTNASGTFYVSACSGGSGGSSTLIFAGNGIVVNASGTNGYVIVNNGVTSTAGNWTGTWQGVNSTTFYLATNPVGYLSSSTGLTYFFPATTTVFYPYANPLGFITSTPAQTVYLASTTPWTLGNIVIASSSNSVTTETTSTLLTALGAITTSTYNASMTIATTLPLGGGASLTNGGTVTLTCTTCLTTSTFNATGTAFYFPYWNASGTSLSATSSIFISSSTGNVGIGTTTLALSNLLTLQPTLTGNTVLINRVGTGTFNGYWGFGVMNTAGTDQMIIGNTGGGYSGSLQWIGASNSFLYYPVTFRIGTGVGTTPTMSFTSTGNVGIGTTAPSSTLHVVGNVQFAASSSLVTPSIGGSALLAGACSTATSSMDASVTSSTAAFITTPQNFPGAGVYWASYLSAPGVLTTEVCEPVAATPTASTYVVKIIK